MRQVLVVISGVFPGVWPVMCKGFVVEFGVFSGVLLVLCGVEVPGDD